MAYTTFYTGSLRYDHTGRKRKNHCANPVKKKNPAINFTKVKIDPVKAEEARLRAEQRQKDKEDFLKILLLKKNLCNILEKENLLVLLRCINQMQYRSSNLTRSMQKILQRCEDKQFRGTFVLTPYIKMDLCPA